MKSLFSFKKDDIWNINEWIKSNLNNLLIAFTIDNFGNLICFDANNDNIVFWNHENDTELVAKNFGEFLGKALRMMMLFSLFHSYPLHLYYKKLLMDLQIYRRLLLLDSSV